MIGQFKTNRRLKLLELTRTYFDVEIVALVADFQDFWPSKPVDTQPVAIDQQTGSTNSWNFANNYGFSNKNSQK